MHKICLIDEESGFKSTLEGYLDNISTEKGDEIDLIYIDPAHLEIDDLINSIVEQNPDLVLIDYKLLLSYDGEDIITKLNYKNPFLPKAILTSNPDEFSTKYIDFRALDKKYVNIDSGNEFYELLIKSINDFNNKKNILETEFDSLHIKVSTGTATNKEINRFIEVDEEITRTYGLEPRINKGILDKTYLGELQEIIDLAKKILNK